MGEESFGSVWGLEEHQSSLHEKKQKQIDLYYIYINKQMLKINKTK